MKVECASCKGTGLYSGFAEPKGVAVICNSCNGKGHGKGFKEFKGRKRKRSIHTVWLDNGLWFSRIAPPASISAHDFYKNYSE